MVYTTPLRSRRTAVQVMTIFVCRGVDGVRGEVSEENSSENVRVKYEGDENHIICIWYYIYIYINCNIYNTLYPTRVRYDDDNIILYYYYCIFINIIADLRSHTIDVDVFTLLFLYWPTTYNIQICIIRLLFLPSHTNHIWLCYFKCSRCLSFEDTDKTLKNIFSLVQ